MATRWLDQGSSQIILHAWKTYTTCFPSNLKDSKAKHNSEVNINNSQAKIKLDASITHQDVLAVHKKNWLPFVPGPAIRLSAADTILFQYDKLLNEP